jgi:uncharacterized RDD family membrane protein YckC
MIAFGTILRIAHDSYLWANPVASFAYYGLSLSLYSRTLGQWIFKQTVVTLNYQRLSWALAFRRAAWIGVSYLFLGLPFLTIPFTSKKQAMHDMLTDVIVVKQRDGFKAQI